MMLRLSTLFIIFALQTSAQKTDTIFLKNLLEKHPEYFSKILNHPTKNEVQVLYTQIDRDENNLPHFRSYSFNLNPKRYFYPASTVKLPTAIFALEKCNQLKLKGIKEALMQTDSAFVGQTKVSIDTSAENGLPSINQYIKKILLVSDNDAYNRLYEFVGREEINQKLKKYGLNQTRIISRLAIGDAGENAKHTNPIEFFAGKRSIYQKPAQFDANDYPMQLENMLQGKGYLDNHDQLINEPFDFREKNIYTISDQQEVLKRLLFPEVYPSSEQFQLQKEDYKLIYKYMSMFPTESNYPKYSVPNYWPTYCKFLFYGSEKDASLNPNIRIFNKVGDSYGYDVDNAYIVDFKNKVEFMLTAVVQSNEDGIYNDNKYEYETVCFPFLKNLGQVIYDLELHRQKKHLPDLNKFKFDYKF
ncbi:MAG: serine hydrolase [Mucilaginibacter sp.]|uniref:serine hydrolase n=1 Tax=Mucilaginibacter sp. TaxID=1882438 RepID=UPI0034E49E06